MTIAFGLDDAAFHHRFPSSLEMGTLGLRARKQASPPNGRPPLQLFIVDQTMTNTTMTTNGHDDGLGDEVND